jgi:3-oxoacyl-[acyl-carrier-protein] synthase-3
LSPLLSSNRLRVLGSGLALPGEPISNEGLISQMARLGVSGAGRGLGIAKTLGISSRHVSRPMLARKEGPRTGCANPDLATRALQAALASARFEANDLGYIIGHTATPHTLLPPNMSWVADLLGYEGPYAELRQACTGFANALTLATSMLASKGAKPIAIVGSETGSLYFDPKSVETDNSQLVNVMQMGDGAGAVILGPDTGAPGPAIESAFYGTKGLRKSPGLCLELGGSAKPFTQDGLGILTFTHDYGAVRESGADLFDCGVAAAKQLGVELEGVKVIIPHQANGRMAKFLAPRLGVPEEKVFVNADHVGNTGSAAIWLAFHELRSGGTLRAGDMVLVLGAEATKFMYGGFLYRHAI